MKSSQYERVDKLSFFFFELVNSKFVHCPFFICVGDELLSVNGTSFEDFTHQQALEIFKVNSE